MTEAGPSDPRRSGRAAALAVACLAGILRVLGSDRRGFWLDELYTLRAAEASLGELVRERIAAGHSPLPFLYARLGLLLGDGETACRSTSALAVAVATYAILRLGARIDASAGPNPSGASASDASGDARGSGVPPALALLCLAHPYWTTIGTEFRYMAPLVALAAVATLLAFDHAAGNGSARRRGAIAGAYALVCAALAWTHGSAQFVLAGLVAFGALEGRARGGGTFRLIAPPLAGFLSSVPLLLLLRGGDGSGPSARSAPALDDVLKEYPQIVFGDLAIWTDAARLPGALLVVPAVAVFWIGIVVARRSWLGSGRGTAWRLTGGSMLGATLAIWLVAAARDGSVQGPVRYIAALSIPATLCLAEAWRATDGWRIPETRWAPGTWGTRIAGDRVRAAFRLGLAALVVVQGAAAFLERGDGHREAVAWVIASHDGASPVLLVSGEMNRFALARTGFERVDLTRELSKRRPTLEETVAEMRAIFADAPGPGLALLYHGRAPVPDAARALRDEGWFVEVREWTLGKTRMLALARTQEAAERLDAIPPPPAPRGPYRRSD